MIELPKRVLAIGAHPDDIELCCAGTLARFVAAGSAIELAVVCKGDKGGATPSGHELATLREAESRKSAAVLGAPIHFLGLPDGAVFDTPQTRVMFLSLLRKVRPELVLTHSPGDYHDDHVQVSALAAKSSWFAASPGHRSEQSALSSPPAVMFFDHHAGAGFDPTHFVDVTTTIETKRRMLECHQSQLARTDSAMAELVARMESLARVRGWQCGVGYAEAFRAASSFGLCRPGTLLP